MTAAAFTDPVLQSQSAFRAILRAMSRPGEIVTVDGLTPPAPLAPAAAAALLTLADFETPLWLSPEFAEAAGWLKFHTGAPSAASPQRAAFALVEAQALDLSVFAQGEPAYPDRSTTVVVQAESLTSDSQWRLIGPGIRGVRRFGFSPLPAGFAAQWRAQGAIFPLGVDLILAAGDRLAALPRSTRLAGAD